MIARLAIAALGFAPMPLYAQTAAPDSSIVVSLPDEKAHAIDRVTSAMLGAGLVIVESSPTGLVVGSGDGPKNTTVRYTASILGAGDTSQVVLSAVATSKASVLGMTPATRVTSKTKGGDKVWAKLTQLAEALKAS